MPAQLGLEQSESGIRLRRSSSCHAIRNRTQGKLKNPKHLVAERDCTGLLINWNGVQQGLERSRKRIRAAQVAQVLSGSGNTIVEEV